MNWDLTKLYKNGFDDDALYADLDFLETESAGIKADLRAADPTKADPQALVDLISRIERLAGAPTMAGAFIYLTLSVEGKNERALKLLDRLTKCEMASREAQSAITTFISKIPGLDDMIKADARLEPYAFFLWEAANAAKHVVDPALEPTVLRLRTTGSSAWSNLYDMLDATHMVDIDDNGEKKQIPLSAARNMAYSADPAVRKQGYEAELASYPQSEQAKAACLNGLKGEALTMFGLTNYQGPIEQTLDRSRMDRRTLDALINVMWESLPDFRRYFKAKARALGHKNGLPFYDLFAPMGKSDATFTLDEAREYLVRVLGSFSKQMADFVDRAFAESWIDAFPREGKRGGAFCAGIHNKKISYILTNFDGSLSDISTLAHELGHAYHNECLKDESVLNTDAPMPLAETASIFNETLLMGAALKNATPEEELMLIEATLSDAAQVVVDILSRYVFETEVFSRRADHSLTVGELKEIMLSAQKQTYGDGLDENCLHPYMWACKSHYYGTDTHFYNFPYAFGLLFGKGVYAQYEQMGEAFLPVYDELLRRTGAGLIQDVAASVGIDVRDEAFWRESVKSIVAMIDRFEALVG